MNSLVILSDCLYSTKLDQQTALLEYTFISTWLDLEANFELTLSALKPLTVHIESILALKSGNIHTRCWFCADLSLSKGIYEFQKALISVENAVGDLNSR